MQASVILPLHGDNAFVGRLLESLTSHTPNGSYDLVIVERDGEAGSAVEKIATATNCTIVRSEGSLGQSLIAGAQAATRDLVVVASPTARFSDNWLDTLTLPLKTAPRNSVAVPRNDFPDLEAIALQRDSLLTPDAVDLAATDAEVFERLLFNLKGLGGEIVEQCAQVEHFDAVPQAPSRQIQPNMLGPGVGSALTEIINAANAGAVLGELPLKEAEMLRERFVAEQERQLLLQARNGRDVCWTDERESEPLVTIRMPTFNRCEQLMELAIPAALAQTYENIELLIVGDHTDEQTSKAVGSLKDPRVRFVNLPVPSVYPDELRNRWIVAGSHPMNVGNTLARGSWIASADDDDEVTPDHVEVLLAQARKERLEFVWSKSIMETPHGWQVIGGEPFGLECTTSGAVMWSAPLRFVKQSSTCWKLNEPQDANLHRRLRAIGVQMGFVDRITYRYYPNLSALPTWQTVMLRCVAVCRSTDNVDLKTARRKGIDDIITRGESRPAGIDINASVPIADFRPYVVDTVRHAVQAALRRGQPAINVFAYEWDTWTPEYIDTFVLGLMEGFAAAPGKPVVFAYADQTG